MPAERDTAEQPARKNRGYVWEVETGARPASERPKAEPRPPKWQGTGTAATYGRQGRPAGAPAARRLGSRSQNARPVAERIGSFKDKQFETLEIFRNCRDRGNFERVHNAHYDWWMFPIDDGSKADWNVTCEADVEALRSDAEWLAGYREGVRLVAYAWGWDVDAVARVEPIIPSMGYRGWDVRLAKICRSLYLFEETALLSSMQTFAREVQRTEKNGKSFFYGRICLDELLYFELPRREAPQVKSINSDAS